jgi:hypothetical protein
LAVVAAVGYTSCEKCVTFEYGYGIPDQEFCEKDKDARDAFESICKLAGGNVK